MKWIKWLNQNIWRYPNVVGFSNKLHFKKVGDKYLNVMSIRIYVKTKYSEKKLLPEHIIPKFIEFRTWRKFWRKQKIPTDVVEIEEPVAFIDKKGKARPMLLGMNVGHHDITAGSLGMLYSDKNRQKFFGGSNAHVLTPNSSFSPEQIKEKRIYNPAPYFEKPNKENIIGLYYWHKQIEPFLQTSNCKLSKFLVFLLNNLSVLLKRKTRFKIYTEAKSNYIDFGVYTLTVPHSLEIADKSINLNKGKFIGHLFGGTKQIGIICKVSYIIKEGFYPLTEIELKVKEGDKVKGCSFWCNYETEIEDSSATILVNYGKFTALFTDVILVKNENVIKGGWSGSGWFKI